MSPAITTPEPVELEENVISAEDLGARLLPILRDYNEKLAELYRDVDGILDPITAAQATPPGFGIFSVHEIRLCSLICRYDTIRTFAEKYASRASGLVDHAPLAYELREDLTANQFELEEQLRQMTSMFGTLLKLFSEKQVRRMEAYIDQTGRGSSPIKKYLK
jgi:hypothetical protein